MLGSNRHRLGWTGQLKQTGNSDRGGYLVKESLGTLIVYVFISANPGFTKFEDKLEYLIELHLKYTIFNINAFQSKSFKSHVTPTPRVALTPSLPVAGASVRITPDIFYSRFTLTEDISVFLGLGAGAGRRAKISNSKAKNVSSPR